MRITIIKADSLVMVDGFAISGIDLSSLPANFHALQWYGENGEVEYVDPETFHRSNVQISSIAPYQPYVDAWSAAKYLIDNPPPLPPQVPASITPRQVRLMLLQQNLLADVESMIAQQDEAAKITWQYALEFRRDDPLLNQLASNLGLTNEQIDQFFISASAI